MTLNHLIFFLVDPCGGKSVFLVKFFQLEFSHFRTIASPKVKLNTFRSELHPTIPAMFCWLVRVGNSSDRKLDDRKTARRQLFKEFSKKQTGFGGCRNTFFLCFDSCVWPRTIYNCTEFERQSRDIYASFVDLHLAAAVFAQVLSYDNVCTRS